MTTAKVQIPPKLIPVFSGEADIRGSYGGRGSAKTRTFAKMTAIRAYMWSKAGREGIILCARQFMNSLDDSSLEEVKAAIRSEPWLAGHFEIGEKYIRTIDGRVSYKFAGLDRNIDSIKSKSRILLCWVDEAEPVTGEAWQTLIPTLREEDSELWVTWNPKSKKSATHKRFRQAKDARMKIAEMNWRDNPWFPAILERSRQKDLTERPDTYDHVWEGDFATVTEGAILARLVADARREKRIGSHVEYDENGPGIEISSDLGFRDTACWWFWQRKQGGFSLLDYDGASGLDADEWIERLEKRLAERGWSRLNKIWLPHDARTKTFQSRHSSIERFIARFGMNRCAIVPMTSKTDRINAARTVIRKCEFNETNCEDGLDGLIGWEYEWNEETMTFSKEPLHNWASHPSDAFSYGCQVMIEAPVEKQPEITGYDPFGKPIVAKPTPKVLTEMTYNEFLATKPKSGRERI